MSQIKTRSNWIGLIVFIAICLGAGGLGAIATTPEIDGWYKTIAKPSWNPPGSVFGPVWTTLFVLMGIAAWLVWKPDGFKSAKTPLTLFAVAARIERRLVVGLLPLPSTRLGLRRDRSSLDCDRGNVGRVLQTPEDCRLLMMMPYLAWVSFASVLNFTIWQLTAG